LWELARRQGKNPEDLIGIPANRILRSLGPESSVDVDVEGPHPLERGDVFLLCSDGLSGVVHDRVLGAVVTVLPPEEAARFLVHLANLQGGPDNITVIVVRVGGEPVLVSDSHSDVVFPESDVNVQATVPRFAIWMYYLSRLPWAFVQLAAGIGLAGFAIALAMVDQGGAMIAFIVAGLALIGGIVTLMVQNVRETRKMRKKPDERVLQVYRQTTCSFDSTLFERVMHASHTLEEDIRQKQWMYDAKAYHERAKNALVLFKLERYREAFREQCRAMMLLMDTIHLYRDKHEGFKPVWDRPAG
jgi:protein phosphatase